jgi:protein TonB
MRSSQKTDALGPIFEATRGDRSWMTASIFVALFAHAALAFALPRSIVARRALAPPVATEIVDIEIPKPPPPPEPTEDIPEARHAPERARLTPGSVPRTAPARAAAVITRKEDPNEPVDLTDAFVSGSATTYAGGMTAASGTNANAVRAVTSSSGTHAPATAAARGSGADRARAPSLLSSTEWDCPFPEEANDDQMDSAVVTIRIDVNVAGAPKNVRVMSDPGHGFGREARRCAMSKRFRPALDGEGNPIERPVTVNVRFQR